MRAAPAALAPEVNNKTSGLSSSSKGSSRSSSSRRRSSRELSSKGSSSCSRARSSSAEEEEEEEEEEQAAARNSRLSRRAPARNLGGAKGSSPRSPGWGWARAWAGEASSAGRGSALAELAKRKRHRC